MKIAFTIYGNQENKGGNPIPKLKMTGRQHWTPKAQGYVAWKEYVNKICQKSMQETPPYYLPTSMVKTFCLDKNQTAYMDLTIWWANEKHADPENVFGSIADALFENDRHLNGSFVALHNPEGKGRVDVVIKTT